MLWPCSYPGAPGSKAEAQQLERTQWSELVLLQLNTRTDLAR